MDGSLLHLYLSHPITFTTKGPWNDWLSASDNFSHASNQIPFPNWFTYYVKFRTLAAADSTLHWDKCHIDLWLECIAPTKQPQKHWPCSFCGSTFHFPENCPKCPFRADKQLPKLPDFRRPQQPTCGDFTSSRCTHTSCRYCHICIICQGNHPAYQCR